MINRLKPILMMLIMMIVFIGINAKNTTFADYNSGTCDTGKCKVKNLSLAFVGYVSKGSSGHAPQAKCNNCKKTYEGSTQSHSGGSWFSCGDEGHAKSCSTCDYIYGLADHTYGSWSKTSETEHQKTCSACGATSTGNHSGGTANCTTAKKCSTCGGYYGSSLGHDMSIYTYTDGGATIHGVQERCARCGTLGTSGTEAHSWGSWETTTNATCTTAGSQKHTCTKCGRTGTESIPALGHSYGAWTTTANPTCVAQGTKRRQCSRCSSYDYGTIAINPDAHNYSKPCGTCGTVNVICSLCGNVKTHVCLVYFNPPVYTSKMTYTGGTLRGVQTASHYTLSGTPTATNVGSYTATATLKESYYRWNDDSSATARTITWQIVDSPITGVSNKIQTGTGVTIDASGNASVKEGTSVTFKVTVTGGSHIKYQWYSNTTNSTVGATAISGATSSTYKINSANRADNGKYYYCVLSNNSDSASSLTNVNSNTAKLTVWYTPSISAQPVDKDIKKSETATFSVSVTGGNPTTYTYQWYKASAASGGTTQKINGATGASYSVTPTSNVHSEWYYCVVDNGYYTLTSNRARLRADITAPVLSLGTVSTSYANIEKEFTVKIKVTNEDSGTALGFNTGSFTADDIKVYVAGSLISPTTKSLTCDGTAGDVTTYTLKLKGVTGDGNLSIGVDSGKISDNFGNVNNSFLQTVSGLTIDNTKPTIAVSGDVTGTNGGYINKSSTITIPVKITDVGGIDTGTFTASDIKVKIDGTEDTGVIKTVNFTSHAPGSSEYYYTITITNITKEGTLSLELINESISDLANNKNVTTELTNLKVGGASVIVDNTKPIVNSVYLALNDYTGAKYPDTIEAGRDNWTNKNVYVTVNAVDSGSVQSGVESYYHSIGTASNFTNMTSNKEIISSEMNGDIYYRVIDKAGNISDAMRVTIKIDKTSPSSPESDVRIERANGEPYVYDASKPSNNTLAVCLPEVDDVGTFKSGIYKRSCKIFKDDVEYGEIKSDGVESLLLAESGHYRFELHAEDKAGNTSDSEAYAYIRKRVENTLTLKNIYDNGSGVKTIEITATNIATNEVQEYILLEEKEITSNITRKLKLSDGKFNVKVIITDGVGLKYEKEIPIENKL